MYVPSSNAEHRPEVMLDYVEAHPLAALVTSSSEGLIATHLPLLVDRTRGALGTLAGHIARANPQQRQAREGDEALVIFSGHDAYITPEFYPSKARDGKVVPTWNYVAVHAYGRLHFVSDPAALRRHLEALTSRHESTRKQPWSVNDAPTNYIERQMGAIVGVEIEITRLEGKWKMSQNRAAEDIDGVIAGLGASADARERAVGEVVRARRPDAG
ncbi:MAG: transcriptional regulator [Gemmatimonadetes bacterium]|nr:MAG: transcriptional regulator [Gemmatimonadota bacterium]